MEETVWIKRFAENEQYIAANVLTPDSVWPTPVAKAYNDLITYMKDGNVYGALLQVRDLYEIIIKMPVLAALIYICGTNKETILNDADILEKWVAKTLSLGDWEALAAGLVNKKNLEKYSLPEILVNSISRTRKLISKKISSGYPNIVNWRNDVIGHGQLQFEDSQDYQEAFPGLMTNLKDYFEGNGKEFRGCDRYFEKIIFKCDGINLQGLHGYNLDDGENLRLEVDGLNVDVGAFAQMRSFFFSSFYYKKGTVKYLDYKSGRNLIKRDTDLNEYILAFNQTDKYHDKKYASKIIRREEEQFLSMLSQPQGYIPPQFVFEKIKQFMDENESGIILLCMERGMGKTAFANSLDSLYHDPAASLIEDTVIRSYPLGNAELRGINDFINAIDVIFTRSFDAVHDFRFSGELKPEIVVCEDNPAETLANTLNVYQEIYSSEYGIYNLILILDGIDEVTVNTGKILEYLPTSELLNEGVYIICMSRPEDEETVAITAKKHICEVAGKSDLCIDIKKDSAENRELLEQYIRQEVPDLDQKLVNELIDRSELRVLYLKVQLALCKSSIQVGEDNLSNEGIASTYAQLLLNKYNGQAAATFRKTAAMICLLGPVNIKDYFEYLSGDEMTYGFIGALNDLLPLLTVRGSDYGREYMLANETYSMAFAGEFHDEIVLLIDEIKRAFINEFFPDESQIDVRSTREDYPIEQLSDPEEYMRLEMESYTKDRIFWVLTIQKLISHARQHGFEYELFDEEFVNYVLMFLDMFMTNNRLDIGYVQTIVGEARKTALNMLLMIAAKGIKINFTDGLACGTFARELYTAEGYDVLIDIVLNGDVQEEVIAQWKNILFSADTFSYQPNDCYIEDKKLIEHIKNENLLWPVVSLFTPDGGFTYLSYLLCIASLDIEKDLTERVLNMIVWSYLSDDYCCNTDEAEKWLAEIKESNFNVIYPKNVRIRERLLQCLDNKGMDNSRDMERLFGGFRCINADLSEVDLDAIENVLTGEDDVKKEAALRELKICFEVMDNIFNAGILPGDVWSDERTQEYYRQCSEGVLGDDEISGDEYAEQYQYTVLDNCRYLLKYLHLAYDGFTDDVLEKWVASLDDCFARHPDEGCFSKLNGVASALYFAVLNYYKEDIPQKLLYLSRYVEKYDARCYLFSLFYKQYSELSKNIVLPTEQSISLMIGCHNAGMHQEAECICSEIAAGNAEFENIVLDRFPQYEFRVPIKYYLNLHLYVSVSKEIGFAAIVNGIQFDFRRELAALREDVRKCNKYSNLFGVQITIDMIISFFRETGIKDIMRDKVFSEMAEIIADKMLSADEETIKAMDAILEKIDNARRETNG